MTEIVLILDNIRSTHNVGAIFRTADAAGVQNVYLSGYTPSPIDRFGRAQKDIAKTALGAEQQVAWEVVPETVPLITELRVDGYYTVALEQHQSALPYRTIAAAAHECIALVLGNEVSGIPEDILQQVDAITEIPQYGTKESLNVSVAAGIMLFALR